MASNEIVELIKFLSIVGAATVAVVKAIVEYFKDRKNTHVTNVEGLVDAKINARLSSIEHQISEMRTEWSKSLIDIFKEFK